MPACFIATGIFFEKTNSNKEEKTL